MKLNSLSALREELNIKPIQRRKEKPVICKKCGQEMTKVATNTWYCKNFTNKKDENGHPKLCGNIYIRSKR